MRYSYGFVDLWVMTRLGGALLALWCSSAPGVRIWEVVLIGIGLCSVMEAVVVQADVLVFGGYVAGKTGAIQTVKSTHRLLVNSLHNYAEIVVWFALLYRNLDFAFRCVECAPSAPSLNSFLVSLNFSFVTMTTFGYSDIRPDGSLGAIVTLVQSAIGFFSALVILASVIEALPTPVTSTATTPKERDSMLEKIEDLVHEILRDYPQPWPTDITDQVFLAIQGDETRKQLYCDVVGRLDHQGKRGQQIVNQYIGKRVRVLTTGVNRGRCYTPLSSLIKSYERH